jgi:hypothetical protein
MLIVVSRSVSTRGPNSSIGVILEWDPLEVEDGEEICVQTFTLDEALAATQVAYRCDPEAALAIWLYAGHSHGIIN